MSDNTHPTAATDAPHPTTGAEMVRAGLIALGASDDEAALLTDELADTYRLNKRIILATVLGPKVTVLGVQLTDNQLVQVINYFTFKHLSNN